MAICPTTTTINDLPDVLLSNIITAISNVRSRNAAALVCQKWHLLERSTRTSLTLRGNIPNIFFLPTCFRSVTQLDLSLLSPWGYPLLSPNTPTATATLIAHRLRQAFPAVTSLTIYARNQSTLQFLAPQWPHLKEIKLVRWHRRPQLASGEELHSLFRENESITKLDLSSFYCWTDDIPAALSAYPMVSSILASLNLLNPSFSEGFKSDEIKDITKSCPNLKELRAACMFDPRYIGFVGDEGLVAVAVNCPKLSVLHLADTSALANSRAYQGFTQDDSSISTAGLIEVFSGLPLLEELALDLCNNVRDSGPALEILNSKCPKLRSLKLGHFHGISMPIESKLGGIAICQGLHSLSISNVGDLTDMGLIAIGRGCWKLSTFEVHGCSKITVKGFRTLASLLNRTLVHVKISFCKNLNAAMSLKALEPVQDRIRRLHIDCVWSVVEEEFEDVEELESSEISDQHQPVGSLQAFRSNEDGSMCSKKRCRHTYDLNNPRAMAIPYNNNNSSGNGLSYQRTWNSLQELSVWIGVGEHLTPLADAGLERCPNLEEIRIKVEGDCRDWSKLSAVPFGLSSLVRYPRLSRMHLDCGDTIGYAHTAPSGQMDLSQWERFYLMGIERLSLTELNYWPPQDRDVNQRSIFLPAAGLLPQCLTLRKLFIHGTAHEHFLNFLLRIPDLRDVQLREDYYPAPENDMSTEMRVDSLSRFEASLNRRTISD